VALYCNLATYRIKHGPCTALLCAITSHKPAHRKSWKANWPRRKSREKWIVNPGANYKPHGGCADVVVCGELCTWCGQFGSERLIWDQEGYYTIELIVFTFESEIFTSKKIHLLEFIQLLLEYYKQCFIGSDWNMLDKKSNATHPVWIFCGFVLVVSSSTVGWSTIKYQNKTF
jgi:hypothetical protein